MRTIKTYEGFFDFLKRKPRLKAELVNLDDVLDCLYDLTDESKIKNQLNGFDNDCDDYFWENVVFKSIKIPMSRFDDEFYRISLRRDKYFIIGENISAFNITYNPSDISDEEVNEILLDCKSKLEIYDCNVSFFIGWPIIEGSSTIDDTSHKEFFDFMKMIDETIKKTDSPDRSRRITIKITSPGGFIKK
jgi:hypothetical protein